MASETARIEAFSDGVFAIAVTLLVLELKVPSPGQGSLAAALLRQWPSYLAYLISFLFIGIMWMNHHRLFTQIARSDEGLLPLNVLLLLGVSVVPFPTAVLATYLGGPQEVTAAALYCSTYLAIAILFNVFWRYARSRGLLRHEASAAAAVLVTRQYAMGPLLYLVCLLLVWFSIPASLFLNLALAIFFALPPATVARVFGPRETQ